MDKIYSRKRIRLPKIYFNRFPNSKGDIRKRRMKKIALILAIGIIIMISIIYSINPVINRLCIDLSRSRATLISNEKATEVMSNYTYDDMMTIYRDTNNNIKMIKSNVITINEIISDIAIKIQEDIEKNSTSKINIRIGSLTGSKLLSGIGPSIPIKLSTSGSVTTKVRSEFESVGINQTIHRIYLDITCNVNILTPYNVIEDSISNEVVLIENVIVGVVPETYYNLEGMEKNNLVDVVE